jgi:filamentous hemagglutinin
MGAGAGTVSVSTAAVAEGATDVGAGIKILLNAGNSPQGSGASPSHSTPGGRPLTRHAQESLRRHGFREPFDQVDDIIENFTRKTTQADGATVYIQRSNSGGRKYNLAILNEKGGVVTAMRNLNPHELRNLARNHGFNPNP